MSRSSALVVALAVLVAAGIGFAALERSRHARPGARTETLVTGLFVDVARIDGAPQAAAALLFRVGADHDPPGRSGLANVLRRAVRARTAGPGFATRVDVDGDGGFTLLSTAGPPDDVDATLRALGRLLADPGLDDDVVQAARAAAIDEVTRRRGADPLLSAESWALEAVAPSRAQGWRGGNADELAAVTRADVESFWRAAFGADAGSLTVRGDIDVDDTIAVAQDAFGALPRSTGASLRAAASTFVHGTLVMGDQPRAVAFATPGPAVSEPAFAPFLVLAARLDTATKTTTTTTKAATKLSVGFDPAMGSTLVVTSLLAEGEAAEAGAARLRAFVDDVVQRPFVDDERTATRTRFAAFFGDGAACVSDLRACTIAQGRRRQLGVDSRVLDEQLAATTSLADGATWFDAQHTALAVAGGVLR
jgi:predicted Zn-dependent peptidase